MPVFNLYIAVITPRLKVTRFLGLQCYLNLSNQTYNYVKR